MEFIIAIVLVIIFIWLSILSYITYALYARYQSLIRGSRGVNLGEILNKTLANTEHLHHSYKELQQKVEQITQKLPGNLQKAAILRFNPFSDTGGDQSFVLALLDATDSGIVLTSLHNRGMTRWYAKNVKNGKGADFDLSEEEEKVIKFANTQHHPKSLN